MGAPKVNVGGVDVGGVNVGGVLCGWVLLQSGKGGMLCSHRMGRAEGCPPPPPLPSPPPPIDSLNLGCAWPHPTAQYPSPTMPC
jgi:hypothetical protein